jgi:predicted ATPase/DNA-binding CsgD family transcriptional regulator
MPLPVRRRVGNLPTELTSFVGRRRELTEAKRLLEFSRLVTMAGVGGVGKTRLALRVAARSGRAFEDGVWLIELGELHDESLLADTIDAAVGLRDQGRESPIEVLTEHLIDWNALLVLDNCEHMVAAIAALVQMLLRRCPYLHILVTSREPLNIGGEAVLQVPPMTIPDFGHPTSSHVAPGDDAVRLFEQRAESAIPGFVLSEGDQITITQICQQLDGLPLAIELAAARLRILSPSQIRDRLGDSLQLLTGGARGGPPRQQTLRLSIEWSYDLCSPLERQLWALLSVFSGGFELDAAEYLCAGYIEQRDVLDVLAGLVDKSVLIRVGTGPVARYRLLEELREFGRLKLNSSGEADALSRRHLDWYRKLVSRAESELIGPRQLEWIARLKREQSNMRDALDFFLSDSADSDAECGLQITAALHTLWLTYGLLSEGRYWLDRMLAHDSGQPSMGRIKALSAASALAAIQGDLPKSVTLVEEAHALAVRLGGELAQAIVSHADGLQALYKGNLDRSIECFEDSLVVFRKEGDILRLIEVLVGLELASGLLGDIPRAVACREEGLRVTEMYGESVQRAYSLSSQGIAAWQSDHELATTLLGQSLRITRLMEHPLTSAWNLEALAWIAAAEHDNQRAAILLGSAASMTKAAGSSTIPLPQLQFYHDECEQQARRSLGAREFDTHVRRGESLHFEEAIAYALNEMQKTHAETENSLTKREWQVARLVSEGLTNKAIADKLVVSPRTAQGHVAHILTKLNFASRAQIAAWVTEQSTSHHPLVPDSLHAGRVKMPRP